MTQTGFSRIGFIGLGLMGTPMTLRLLGSGFDVCVWNRSKERYAAVTKVGAVPARTIRQLVTRSEVVLLCLKNTNAVEDVVFGPNGVAAAGRAGQVLVDFSSTDPARTRECAQRLARLCGMRWIDAPVSGGVSGAEKGELIIMAGGDATVLATLQHVFAPLSCKVARMGGVGAGQTTKLCNQMIVGCNALVIAETVALARSAGIEVSGLVDALSGGFADSAPFRILVPQMAAHDFSLKWRVETLQKDLESVLKMAWARGWSLPMLELGTTLMADHAARGYAEKDVSTLIRMYEADPPPEDCPRA